MKKKLFPMSFTSQLAFSSMNVQSAGQLRYERIQFQSDVHKIYT